MNSYLALAEASQVTGLNEKTLNRFIDAGYIQTREKDNHQFLSIEDLNKTFGLSIETPSKKSESELEIEVTSHQPNSFDHNTIIIEQIVETDNTKHRLNQETKVKNEHDSILEKVIALQDRLLEDKDSQLNEQQKEIKWLRTRIEKLEDQSEKDKILLLSGNQTINRLIDLNGTRKSWIERTLTWIGSKD